MKVIITMKNINSSIRIRIKKNIKMSNNNNNRERRNTYKMMKINKMNSNLKKNRNN